MLIYKLVCIIDLPYLKETSPAHKEKAPAVEEKVVSGEDNICVVINLSTISYHS